MPTTNGRLWHPWYPPLPPWLPPWWGAIDPLPPWITPTLPNVATRGPLSPDDFPATPGAPQPAPGAPQPTPMSAVPAPRDDGFVVVLKQVSDALKAELPRLADPKTADLAQRRIGMLSAYLCGVLEARGMVQPVGFIDRFLPSDSGGDLTQDVGRLLKGIDDIIAAPATRIFAILIAIAVLVAKKCGGG